MGNTLVEIVSVLALSMGAGVPMTQTVVVPPPSSVMQPPVSQSSTTNYGEVTGSRVYIDTGSGGTPESESIVDDRSIEDNVKNLGYTAKSDKGFTTNSSQKRVSDDCPENLSLEQLQSYTLLEKRPPLEHFSNKTGCVGDIVYNSAEERIIYYTKDPTSASRVTDASGKTIFSFEKERIIAELLDGATAYRVPLSEYTAEAASSFSCAGQYITSTQVAIGAGAAFFLVSTPLALYVAIRRKEKVAETVYTSTRMGA